MGSLKDVSRRLFFKQGALDGDGSHEALMESNLDYVRLVNAENAVG
jgi:ABC-type multidrug transport system fused ATPase/permease subunit